MMDAKDYAAVVERVKRGEDAGFLSDSQRLTVALSLGRLGSDDLNGLTPGLAWMRIDERQRDVVRTLNEEVASPLSLDYLAGRLTTATVTVIHARGPEERARAMAEYNQARAEKRARHGDEPVEEKGPGGARYVGGSAFGEQMPRP